MADSGTYTPETLARHYKIAQSLMEDPKAPYTHWAQPLAEITKKGLGGYIQGRTEESEKEQRAAATAQIAALFGGAPAQSASMPVSPTAAPADGQPAPTQMDAVPRGLRNNNPLNIEAGSFTQGQPGFSGSDGRFAKFETPEAGIGAANKLLDTYQNKYGLNTPAGIVGRWAPAKDGNNVSAYAQNVAQQLGINPNDPITPQMRPQLIAAMGQHENGRPIGDVAAALGAPAQPQGSAPPTKMAQNTPFGAVPPGGQPTGAAPAGLANNPNSAKIAAILTSPWIDPSVKQAVMTQMSPSYGFQTLPDGTILRTNPKTGQVEPIYSAPVKPELKESGTDPITGQKSYQVWDAKTKTMQPVAGPGGAPTTPQSGFLAPGVTTLDHSLSGDDYLKQFGPEVQAAVKSYMNGDVMPSGNPRMQSLANTAKTIAQKYGADMGIPVSDATYSQRRTYRSQLGSNSPSSSGGQAKAFGQGIEHMDHLADTLEKLDNSNGMGIPFVANTINAGRQAISTDQSAISDKASSIGQTLAGEVGKLFSGSAGGGVHERELTRERFSTVKSKPQLAAALEGTLEMMKGGLTALEQRRDEVMGQNSGINFVNDETKAKIAKIEETISRLKGGGSPPKAEVSADPIEAEMRKRGLLK